MREDKFLRKSYFRTNFCICICVGTLDLELLIDFAILKFIFSIFLYYSHLNPLFIDHLKPIGLDVSLLSIIRRFLILLSLVNKLLFSLIRSIVVCLGFERWSDESLNFLLIQLIFVALLLCNGVETKIGFKPIIALKWRYIRDSF